ncbi:MAG: hypothetical protein ACFFCZ_20225 [Promethearchaeota archaeon]
MAFGPQPSLADGGGGGAVTEEEEIIINSRLGDTTVVDPAAAISYVDALIAAQTSALEDHTTDSTIHFLESSIDHTAILNIGTNSHSDIDTHIGDSTKHFTEASIDHTAILNIGTNSHSSIDTHIGDSTKHFTEASIDHTAISNIGTNSHSSIDTHIAAASPHSAHATLSGGIVPSSELGSGTPDEHDILRGDRVWAAPLVSTVGLKLVYNAQSKIEHDFWESNLITKWDGSRWITVEIPDAFGGGISNQNTKDLDGNDLVANANYGVFTEPVAAWSSGDDYPWARYVTYNSYAYRCIAASGSGTNSPTGAQTDNAYWEYITDNPDLLHNLMLDKWSSSTARQAALYLFDGRYVQANTTAGKKRLHLGDVRTADNSGPVFACDNYQCFIWNRYLQDKRTVRCYNANLYWACTATSIQESYGGTGQTRGELILGEAQSVILNLFQLVSAPASYASNMGIGWDSTSTFVVSASIYNGYIENPSVAVVFEAAIGYHYMTSLEVVGGGSGNFYGQAFMSGYADFMG